MITRIAAAINASPESFYAGSVASGAASVAEAVRRAEADGAHLIDIGAMSTAPYKETQISEEEEAGRMIEAIRAAREVTALPISADTQRAAVAEAALKEGAVYINDVRALAGDDRMGEVIARYNVSAILMANDEPDLDEAGETPVGVVCRLLREAVARADAAGIARDRIILDPGVGFFRHRSLPWYEWDIQLLRGLEEFRAMGFPIMIGASRKSFIGKLLGREGVDERLAGSLAVAYHCAQHHVEWLRVHDVKETRDVLELAGRLKG